MNSTFKLALLQFGLKTNCNFSSSVAMKYMNRYRYMLVFYDLKGKRKKQPLECDALPGRWKESKADVEMVIPVPTCMS